MNTISINAHEPTMWPWQAILSLCIIVLFTIYVIITFPLYWRLRHTHIMSAQLPYLCAVTTVYNLLCIYTICLQCMLLSLTYAGYSNIPNFPCQLMLIVGLISYPLFSIPGSIRAWYIFVRYDSTLRKTRYVNYLNTRYQIRTLSILACLSVVVICVYIGIFKRYQHYTHNTDGYICVYAQEWYSYMAFSTYSTMVSKKLSIGLKSMHDSYGLANKIRADYAVVVLLSWSNLITNMIFDILDWINPNIVNRSTIALHGLPYHFIIVILHIIYYTRQVPINTYNYYQQVAAEQKLQANEYSTTHTSTTGYRPSNLDSLEMLDRDDMLFNEHDDMYNDDIRYDDITYNDQFKYVDNININNNNNNNKRNSNRYTIDLNSTNDTITPQRKSVLNSYDITMHTREQTRDLIQPTRRSSNKSQSYMTALNNNIAERSQTIISSNTNTNTNTSTQQHIQHKKRPQHITSSVPLNTRTITHNNNNKPKKWNCLRCLRDPTMFVLLSQHAKKTLNGEYTEFWADIEAYRSKWYARRTALQLSQLHMSTSNLLQTIDDDKDDQYAHIPLDKKLFCIYINDKYIKINSPYELNISDNLRTQFNNIINTEPIDLVPETKITVDTVIQTVQNNNNNNNSNVVHTAVSSTTTNNNNNGTGSNSTTHHQQQQRDAQDIRQHRLDNVDIGITLPNTINNHSNDNIDNNSNNNNNNNNNNTPQQQPVTHNQRHSLASVSPVKLQLQANRAQTALAHHRNNSSNVQQQTTQLQSQQQQPIDVTKYHNQRMFSCLMEIQKEVYKLINTNLWLTFKRSKEFIELNVQTADDDNNNNINKQ